MTAKPSSSKRGSAARKNELNSQENEPSWSTGERLKALVEIATAILVLSGVIYTAYTNYRQSSEPIKIAIAATQTAEAKPTLSGPSLANIDNVAVAFNNPKTNLASVQLLIKDGDHPNDDPIVNIVIPPGGTAPQNLAPGNYQIEARPIYPAITPSSANCYIQWQQSDSYKGDLVITANKAMIQIKQFDLEPQEICFTETPVPLPTPTQ